MVLYPITHNVKYKRSRFELNKQGNISDYTKLFRSLVVRSSVIVHFYAII